MARCKVSLLVFLIFRGDMLAYFLCVGATGMEAASLGGIGGRRNISLEDDTLHLLIGIRIGNRREQRLGIGVDGVRENVFLGAKLHHLTQIHDADFVGDKLDPDKS